jgi:hypothetical protein
MKKSLNFLLLPLLVLIFTCSETKKETTENPVVAEKDYYQILMDAFNGAANLPADFAAVLDDSFPPRGSSPLLSFKTLDNSLGELWLFATTISDNGFSIIKPAMKGKTKYNVPGTNIQMDLDVEEFLMNVAIHTKTINAVIDDEEGSSIRGIFPNGQNIHIVVGGVPYDINREWVRQNSYFSAYLLLAKALVLDVVVKEGEYPIPADPAASKYEIITFDGDGNVKDRFSKPSDLLYAIAGLSSDNPTLTYEIKLEASAPADLNGDGVKEETIYLPYALYGKADISFPLLTNYTGYTTNFLARMAAPGEECHFIDPTKESANVDPDATMNQIDSNPSWWLPNIPPGFVAKLPIEQQVAMNNVLFIDEGERGFDVDWWRDLEVLTLVPGLGLSDVGIFDTYSGILSGGGTSVDLSTFNKNGKMDSDENRAVFFDRVFRMNGFRLTDNGNFTIGETPYPEAGLMDSPKIDIDAQGNITFGGKYDGPTRLVGVHALADSIPPAIKILFYLKGLVPAGTVYDATGIAGYSQYIKNVKAYLPCELNGGWQEVNMPQLLQYVANHWDKIKFYEHYFANADVLTLADMAKLPDFLAKLPLGQAFGMFPMVDKGEINGGAAPFIIRADITIPEKGMTYEGLEILSSSFGGFYNTNFYKGALSQ